MEAPRGNDTTSAFPELAWQRFTTSFPFTYVVTVLDQEFEAVFWIADSLQPDTTRVIVTDSLEDGDYYWTLTVQDVFENTSRSKEGEFIVFHGVLP